MCLAVCRCCLVQGCFSHIVGKHILYAFCQIVYVFVLGDITVLQVVYHLGDSAYIESYTWCSA